MTDERKSEIREYLSSKDKHELEDFLGMAIHFDFWDRAIIIRDIAKDRGITLTPTPWQEYFDRVMLSTLDE